MSPIGYHLVLRLADDRVIAPSRGERRRWARQLAALSRLFPVIAWKLADTHLHVVLLVEGGEFVRRLRIWVTTSLKLGVPLEVQRHKPLAGQSHLVNAFHYTLRQDRHHGLELDTFHEASSLPDTLGLRVLAPELPTRVKEHLPRVSRHELLAHLGVDTLDEALHIDHLAASARAILALDELGRDDHSYRARRAAVGAARQLGPAALAATLCITPQGACRLAKRVPPPRELRAVRLQMALHEALAATVDLGFVSEPAVPYEA